MSNQAPKKKGPIRTEAIIPVGVILLIIFAYFKFFFDMHLKSGIEWGASYVHGAEVNVADVDTSFLKLFFEMQGLQVTDKEHPERNIVSIGKIRFDLLPDAVLRMKGVVEEASILDIQVFSPRKSKGYVRPPTPAGAPGASIVDDIEARAESRLKQQYENNVVMDIANIAGGTDAKEQLKSIQAQLKSEEKINEAKKFVKEKEEEWKKRIEEFPKKDEVDALVRRAKNLKFDTKNPLQFAQSLKDADEIYKQLDEKVKLVQKTSGDLKSDISTTEQSINDIEKFVQEDVEDLKKRFKVPSFDPKSFTQGLFTSMLNEKIASAEKYVAVAREYMPNKKKESSQDLVPPKRGSGQNVLFPITKGYPSFWLKKAAISSQANTSEFSGNIKGELTNVTTSPRVIGKPAVLKFDGDFPKQQIYGLNGNITVDHTRDIPKESFNFKVGAYPLKGMKMIDSSDLKFNLLRSTPAASFGGVIENENISLALQNVFKRNQFEVDAKKEFVKNIFNRVVAGLPEIVLNASFEGSFANFDTSLNSNLGSELADGFKKEIQAEIDKKRKEIENFVQDRIKGERAKLTQEFDKVKNKFNAEIGGKTKDLQGEIDKAKGEITKQKSAGGGEGSGNPLKDALKKKFKF
ncbi:MAG: TIGR03545 family protein [Bdellovibrionota bacterium]